MTLLQDIEHLANTRKDSKKDIANFILTHKLELAHLTLDAVFASKIMGDGVAIMPETTEIVAPFDGKVETLFPTKHAIGIISDSGAEILIHVGINTVDLKGDGFKTFVKQGERITKGQKLLAFNKEAIEKAGYSTQTMVVVTNTSQYKTITKYDNQFSKAGDLIIELEK